MRCGVGMSGALLGRLCLAVYNGLEPGKVVSILTGFRGTLREHRGHTVLRSIHPVSSTSNYTSHQQPSRIHKVLESSDGSSLLQHPSPTHVYSPQYSTSIVVE
jgi:hypothetical protein